MFWIIIQATLLFAPLIHTAEESKGSTKLVIATGYDAGTLLDTIEVLDLSSESKTCNNLPNFPKPISSAVGGVHNLLKPVICGGFNAIGSASMDCFTLKDNLWTEIESMITARGAAAITALPSATSSSNQDFLVIGGDNYEFGFVATVEAYTSEGWGLVNSLLPQGTGIFKTCAVTLDSTSAMVIGGTTIGKPSSSTTYIYDALEDLWDELAYGLMEARNSHSCGVIRTEDLGNYVIVAGGVDESGNAIATTEILEPDRQEWSQGPSLPQALYGGVIVEDSLSRSVIYVGGQAGDTESSPNLYRLSAPLTSESQWELLPQQMKTPRSYLTAFFIPDNFVECNNANKVTSTLADS